MTPRYGLVTTVEKSLGLKGKQHEPLEEMAQHFRSCATSGLQGDTEC
jgi:hypothetical protein